jgi:hypothetical protein
MIRFSGSNSWQRSFATTATCLILTISIGCPLVGSANAATLQVGFSPEGSAQTLVLDVIHTAKHDIRMTGTTSRHLISRTRSSMRASAALT